MPVTNPQPGTNVHEIADGTHRINTSIQVPVGVGGFSFNQYLVVDDEPLLFRTGPHSFGRHAVRWFDTPHLPHAWECGFLMEETSATLLGGDLFPRLRPARGHRIGHPRSPRGVLPQHGLFLSHQAHARLADALTDSRDGIPGLPKA